MGCAFASPQRAITRNKKGVIGRPICYVQRTPFSLKPPLIYCTQKCRASKNHTLAKLHPTHRTQSRGVRAVHQYPKPLKTKDRRQTEAGLYVLITRAKIIAPPHEPARCQNTFTTQPKGQISTVQKKTIAPRPATQHGSQLRMYTTIPPQDGQAKKCCTHSTLVSSTTRCTPCRTAP